MHRLANRTLVLLLVAVIANTLGVIVGIEAPRSNLIVWFVTAGSCLVVLSFIPPHALQYANVTIGEYRFNRARYERGHDVLHLSRHPNSGGHFTRTSLGQVIVLEDAKGQISDVTILAAKDTLAKISRGSDFPLQLHSAGTGRTPAYVPRKELERLISRRWRPVIALLGILNEALSSSSIKRSDLPVLDLVYRGGLVRVDPSKLPAGMRVPAVGSTQRGKIASDVVRFCNEALWHGALVLPNNIDVIPYCPDEGRQYLLLIGRRDSNPKWWITVGWRLALNIAAEELCEDPQDPTVLIRALEAIAGDINEALTAARADDVGE